MCRDLSIFEGEIHLQLDAEILSTPRCCNRLLRFADAGGGLFLCLPVSTSGAPRFPRGWMAGVSTVVWVVSTPNNQKEPANQVAEGYTEGVSLRAEQLTGTVQ